MDMAFCRYVDEIIREKKGVRVHQFEYKGQYFWLKQPEKLSGIEQFLKPRARQAFQAELHQLQQFARVNASVPKVVYYGNDFFVLEDVGKSLSQLMDDESISEDKKFQLLSEACFALIGWHRCGLVHGRPAIRDLTWQDGKISFLDFEAQSHSQNKNWLISRDMLFFFDSLCREKSISDKLIGEVADYYQAHCQPQYWEGMMRYLRRFKWLYYLLLPFKPIAKTDLIAIYRLFELLMTEKS